MSTTPRPHRRGIQSFTVYDHDDAYAPPERPILVVSVVDDVTFLVIRKGDPEDGTSQKVAEIAVDTASLAEGLQASIRADRLVAARSEEVKPARTALGADR